MRLTPSNLVDAIDKLPKDVWFDYPTPKTTTKVRVVSVVKPKGPIKVARRMTNKDGSYTVSETSLSSAMIQRYANAVTEGIPVNADRVFGASFNTRSLFETLVANTPEFYVCYPGRVEYLESSYEVKKGHKHLVWMPEEPHRAGEIHRHDISGMTVVERPSVDTLYGVVDLPEDADQAIPLTALEIEAKRRHTRMQIALAKIGHGLGYRTYIAANDQKICYEGKPLVALPNVLGDLREQPLLRVNAEAVDAARLIDCVWFQNGKLMPAVLEVEESTGTWSGLRRMQTFRNLIPAISTRYVIVAPDEDRDSVLSKISDPQFKSLKAKFFPYSAVEELRSLCERRKIRGVDDTFLDCFMETVEQ